MPDGGDWDEHSHEAVVHTHGHYHVTHNFREATGGFEHLSSYHEHEHDHAAMRHRHFPHENYEQEHAGEAHIHDHAETVKPARKRAAPKKAAAPVGRNDGG